MSELQVFESVQVCNVAGFGDLRVVIDEQSGNPWFCAKDAAIALGYSNPSDAVRRHCKSAGRNGCVKRYPIQDNMGRIQNVQFINEGDLYRLITHSKLEKAIEFEHEVFDVILPTIRKTGGYEVKPRSDDEIILLGYEKALARVKALEEKNAELDSLNKNLQHSNETLQHENSVVLEDNDRLAAACVEDAHKVAAYEAFLNSDILLSVTRAGRVMAQIDPNAGGPWLYEKIRADKYCCKNTREATLKGIRKKWFVNAPNVDSNGVSHGMEIRVTMLGLDGCIQRYLDVNPRIAGIDIASMVEEVVNGR